LRGAEGDEAIQTASVVTFWIASLSLAMTSSSRVLLPGETLRTSSRGRRHLLRSALLLPALFISAAATLAQALPGGFVHLRDIDPTIIQDIRYAGADNFIADNSATFDPRKAYADCTAPVDMRAPEGRVDMGTGYDCADVKAHTAASTITPAQRHRRNELVSVMARQGFVNYPKEWWHFSLPGAGGAAYDFPIEPRRP
jgi:D-alanyl-D-alanine dipeptidase